MEWALLWIVLCFIPAIIANNKGRSAIGYFFLSVLLSPLVGTIIILLVRTNQVQVKQRNDKEALASSNNKQCQYCGEVIKKEAIKCRYCGSDLTVQPAPPKQSGWARTE